MINRSTIEKIRSRYNPEYDMPSDAPVQWSVMELAELVDKLITKVEAQAVEISALQGEVDDLDAKLSNVIDENNLKVDYESLR